LTVGSGQLSVASLKSDSRACGPGVVVADEGGIGEVFDLNGGGHEFGIGFFNV
jgi:hypothetical protein